MNHIFSYHMKMFIWENSDGVRGGNFKNAQGMGWWATSCGNSRTGVFCLPPTTNAYHIGWYHLQCNWGVGGYLIYFS